MLVARLALDLFALLLAEEYVWRQRLRWRLHGLDNSRLLFSDVFCVQVSEFSVPHGSLGARLERMNMLLEVDVCCGLMISYDACSILFDHLCCCLVTDCLLVLRLILVNCTVVGLTVVLNGLLAVLLHCLITLLDRVIDLVVHETQLRALLTAQGELFHVVGLLRVQLDLAARCEEVCVDSRWQWTQIGLTGHVCQILVIYSSCVCIVESYSFRLKLQIFADIKHIDHLGCVNID